MKLSSLLKGQNYLAHKTFEDQKVSGITTDSRHVTPDSLFIAIKPLDGSSNLPYIREAIQNGATYILKDHDVKLPSEEIALIKDKITFIDVKNARSARAQIAANLYPYQPDQIAAVTGTNGKTSTVNFLRQIWEISGLKAASIGTLGLQTNVSIETVSDFSFSTPDPFLLHQIMCDLTEAGVNHACMEASSHGIDQYRLEKVNLTAAAFTNLSHEHLDYHGTMEAYFEAKRRLFSEILPEGSVAVLNADDFHFQLLYNTCRERGHQIISFGRQAKDIQLLDATLTEKGQALKLKIFGKNYWVTIPLIGLIQGYNVMTAIGLAHGCGMEIDAILSTLEHIKSVPGRFERVGQHPSGGIIYVDYAHKPLALETVLTSLKPHIKGTLTVVFGCGGNRDIHKRSMMGEIAEAHSDVVIVTDDNPRQEDPTLIRQQIRQGCPQATEIPDRREAIIYAISKLGSHDVCVVAGKGHEQGQIIGDKIIPFDDREVIREELRKLGGVIF